MEKAKPAGRPPTYDLRSLREGCGVYASLDQLAGEFLRSADRCLGPALAEVPTFLQGIIGEEGRPDECYRHATPERYSLELLACTIMARQFWPDFVARRDTVLILPDCLRIRQKGCGRKKTRFGSACTACHPDCLVARITGVGALYGAPAYFSDMDHPKQFKALRKKHPDLSVVGVACVLMLANGMRAAEAAGVPSQGVLLTYCGCDHWTHKPFTTHAEVERVVAILKAKADGSSEVPI